MKAPLSGSTRRSQLEIKEGPVKALVSLLFVKCVGYFCAGVCSLNAKSDIQVECSTYSSK